MSWSLHIQFFFKMCIRDSIYTQLILYDYWFSFPAQLTTKSLKLVLNHTLFSEEQVNTARKTNRWWSGYVPDFDWNNGDHVTTVAGKFLISTTYMSTVLMVYYCGVILFLIVIDIWICMIMVLWITHIEVIWSVLNCIKVIWGWFMMMGGRYIL